LVAAVAEDGARPPWTADAGDRAVFAVGVPTLDERFGALRAAAEGALGARDAAFAMSAASALPSTGATVGATVGDKRLAGAGGSYDAVAAGSTVAPAL
jgi:hypothetical protein